MITETCLLKWYHENSLEALELNDTDLEMVGKESELVMKQRQKSHLWEKLNISLHLANSSCSHLTFQWKSIK